MALLQIKRIVKMPPVHKGNRMEVEEKEKTYTMPFAVNEISADLMQLLMREGMAAITLHGKDGMTVRYERSDADHG